MPVIFVILMGAIIFLFLMEENVCDTPIGYCSSISCVCGNVLWQGYVFMFVTLSLGPALLMIGITDVSQPRLCCRNGSRDGKGLTFMPFIVVWSYLIGCSTWSFTGIMPWILPGRGITPLLASFSQQVHGIGVQTGTLLPLVSALFLGIMRARDSCRQGGAKSGCAVLFSNLCRMERAACGCFGYICVLPLLLVATVFGMKFTAAHGTKLETVFDICVGNTDEISCRNGTSCQWQPGELVPCVNPDCDPNNPLAVVAEYLCLCLAFVNLCVLHPGVKYLVEHASAPTAGTALHSRLLNTSTIDWDGDEESEIKLTDLEEYMTKQEPKDTTPFS